MARAKPHTRKAPAAEPAPILDVPKSHMAGAFRNRIVGYEAVDPKTIKRNPLNWRTHPDSQKATMRDALEQLGFVDACIVSHRTRMLIDGEMRLDLAIENNEPTVPVIWVDLTPDEEKLALAIINPMGELAGLDPEKLQRVLAGREPAGGPLDDLLRSLSTMADGAIVKPTGKNSGARAVGKTLGHTMRVVLAVPETASFERAIAATGILNRGEAVCELARFYLEGHAKGQHNSAAESGLAAQLTQAVRAGTRRT